MEGTFNMCHYFIKATGGKGMIINLVTLATSFVTPGISSYAISKLAEIKLGEHLHAGNFVSLALQISLLSASLTLITYAPSQSILNCAFSPSTRDWSKRRTGAAPWCLSSPLSLRISLR